MPSPTFHCPSCLFSFDQLHWLVAHLLELNCAALLAHGGGPPTEFNCTLCGHRLFSCQQLADHLKLCHSHEQATNENAEEVIEKDLLADQQSSQQVAEATTMFVDQQPQQEQQRRQRTARHQCQSCDRAFPKLVDLRRHERTHTGERPFGCPQCQRHFKLKQTLESHMKTHREARPEEHFECSVCAKKFLSRSALRLHLRIHTDERPFNCAEPLCTETFRTKKLMLTHHRNCHQNNIDNDDNSQSQHETQTLDVQHGRLPEKGRLETRAQREAAYALLKLNPRMGARAKKAKLNRSEHSAFSEYNKAGAGTIQLQISSHSHQLIQSVPVGYCDSAAVAQHSLSENMQTTNCSSQHQQQQQQQMIQLQQEQSVQSVPVGYCNSTAAQQSAPCSLSATSCPSQHQQQLAQLQQQQQQQSAVACTSGLNVMSAFPFGSSAAVPNQQQPPLAFFQTADAEYTREGQVHNRRQTQLPSQQFRTLTPPLTFMYYYSDSQQQEAMMRPAAAVGFIHPQQQHQPQLCPLQPMHQQQQSTENQGQQQQPGHLRNY